MNNDINTVELAIELTVAWLGNHNNRTTTEEVPLFLRSIHDALYKLARPGTAEQTSVPEAEFKHAVSVRKSLASPDHIVSMLDGKPYKSLRRHLSANGLSPEDYRARYGLKADYPMVAPSYSEARRAIAKTIGLGRKPGKKVKDLAKHVSAPVKAVAKRGRKSTVEAKTAVQAHLVGGRAE
jgi:predicted transcriptional regulator